VLAAGALLEPAEVAEAVVRGLADGRFLILPHPEVAEFAGRRPRPLAGRHAPRPGAAVGSVADPEQRPRSAVHRVLPGLLPQA
jgi:hypothetical protein